MDASIPPPYEALGAPLSFTMRHSTLPTVPTNLLSHYINIVPHASPSSFPYPEPSQVWALRDVHHEDWTNFVDNLLYIEPGYHIKHEKNTSLDLSEAEYDLLQKMYETLAEWNEGFFSLRGLKIVAGGETLGTRERTAAAATKEQGLSGEGQVATKGEVAWKFGQDSKFGLQLGSVLVGLEFGGEKKAEK